MTSARIINTPGTTPTAKITAIAHEIETWAHDELGIQIDHFYGSTTWPDHSNRRCLDIMVSGPKGQQPTWVKTGKVLSAAESKTFGGKVRAYVIEHAKRLGANGVIWNRQVTGFPHVDNPPYRGPYGEARTYTGPSPHTDHNHLEVDSTAYVAPPKPLSPNAPTVDLSQLLAAAKADPARKQGGTTSGSADDVLVVEAALRRAGYLDQEFASDGSFGSSSVAAYAEWQRALGYTGADADGLPGETSLKALGKRYGFRVVA